MGLQADNTKSSGQSLENSAIRVLVVDANARQAAATRRALKAPPTPFVVSPARQLWSAIQILSGVPIDVILLSLDLARSDAEAADDEEASEFPGLKNLQNNAADRPILVLGNDRERGARAVQAGAADFLVTGADQCSETLRKRTQAAVERRRAVNLEAAALHALPAAAPMRILLIDEDALVLRLLRRNLERRGHRVTSYQSAHEAIEFAKSASFSFDLLICDERQGGMEGMRLSQILRRYASELRTLFFCDQPLSSADDLSAHMGSIFQLVKPYTLTEFGEILERIEARYPWPGGLGCAPFSGVHYPL